MDKSRAGTRKESYRTGLTTSQKSLRRVHMKELQTKLYGLTIRARHFRAFNRPDKQDGATAIEYALIAGLIAVAIIAGARLLGTNLDAMFDGIAGIIGSETPSDSS